MHGNSKINKDAKDVEIDPCKSQFTAPKQVCQLHSKLDKLMNLTNHEYFAKNEKILNTKELCSYFEIYIRYVRNSYVRNMIYKKRCNINTVLRMIINVC